MTRNSKAKNKESMVGMIKKKKRFKPEVKETGSYG